MHREKHVSESLRVGAGKVLESEYVRGTKRAVKSVDPDSEFGIPMPWPLPSIWHPYVIYMLKVSTYAKSIFGKRDARS